MAPVLVNCSRRLMLAGGLGLALQRAVAGQPKAVPLSPLVFPRDLGSHPDFSIEWWYVTGQLLAGTDTDRHFKYMRPSIGPWKSPQPT